MSDKAKLLKVAQKHLSKGNVDKAIKTFEQLVAVDPRDQRLILRLAELQSRAGRKKEAIQNYEKIATWYIRQDFTPKAIAVYKTIVRLDPELLTAYEKLAELYKSQGLEAEALSQLENLFNVYERKKDESKQIDVLKLMVDMDPENLGFQVRLGETLAKKGRKQEAAEAFAKAAATLSRRGFHDRASQLFEKIIGLDPGNTAVRKELCAHYLESGQFQLAQKEIEAILELEPNDPRMVLLLSRILFQLGNRSAGEKRLADSLKMFLESGELEAVMREYLFVAQSHMKNGEVNEAEAYYRKISEVVPTEVRAFKGLVSVAEARKDRVAQIKALATLGRIYQQAGDRKGARRSFEKVHELDPLNEEAKTFIESALHEAEEDEPGAVSDIRIGEDQEPSEGEEVAEIQDVEILDEEVLETLDAADDIESLDDETVEVQGLTAVEALEEVSEDDSLPDIELEDFDVEDAGAPEEVSPEPEEPAFEVAEEEFTAEELIAEAQVYERYGLRDKVEEMLEKARVRAMGDADLLGQIQTISERMESTASQGPQQPEEVPEAAGELGAAIEVPGMEEEISLQDSAADPFEEDLEEAEFYLSQGLEDEARRIYKAILQRSPGHEAATRAMAGLQGEMPAAPASAEHREEEALEVPFDAQAGREVRSRLIVKDAGPEGVGDFLNLADELRTELAEEFEHGAEPAAEEGPVTFEEIFAQFKKGIEETLGDEEYETHYNLGIAYKDMGLYDDAIREFEMGARDPDLVQDSLSLMAMCFVEKKDYDSAAKAVLKAMENAPESTKAGLFYQLGDVHERRREWSQALEAYEEVQSRDPSFQGIDEILHRIRASLDQGAPAPEEGEEAFEAGMDDMLSDLIREVEEMARESSGETGDEPGKSKKDRISYL